MTYKIFAESCFWPKDCFFSPEGVRPMDAEFKMDVTPEQEMEALMMDLAHQEKSDLVNLQMILATSSMNHEYTRKAYEKTRSYARRQELEVKMANLKNMYFAARNR